VPIDGKELRDGSFAPQGPALSIVGRELSGKAVNFSLLLPVGSPPHAEDTEKRRDPSYTHAIEGFVHGGKTLRQVLALHDLFGEVG
jgi:hypothetical protein